MVSGGENAETWRLELAVFCVLMAVVSVDFMLFVAPTSTNPSFTVTAVCHVW